MMKKTFLFGLTAVIAAVMVLAGCGSAPASGAISSTSRQAARAEVNWNTESAGTLTVTNNTGSPFILFAGAIANQNIIGGIRQGPNVTRTFDVFNDVSEENGAFLLRAVEETVYRSKGSDLREDDVRFARLVTYDKKRRDMKTDIIIDNRSAYGGNEIVYFENDSNLVLEVRADSPTGEKVTTLAPFQRKKAVRLPATPEVTQYGYTFYPTYIYYDERQHDVRSITTSDLKQGMSARPVDPDSGENVPFVPFPPPNTGNIFHPVATVVVVNESGSGVLFRSGNTPMLSIRGIGMINSGGAETFELDMRQLTVREIGGLNIDPRQGQTEVKNIEARPYRAGWNYTLTLRQNGTLSWSEDGFIPEANKLTISLVNEIR
jgi:hypothetical protein